MTTQAATYRRISDDREGRELGVSRQREDLEAFTAREGLTVVQAYSDNDTGASTRSKKRRPGYENMIKDAAAGKFSVIVAYTTSRLTRRPMEWEGLIQLAEKHNIRYRFIASPEYDLNTADGRMTARIAASIDTAEAERTAERGTRARKQQRQAGRFGGGTIPWWLTPVPDGSGGKRLVHVPERVELVRQMVDRILRGESQASVCRDWNANPEVPKPSRATEWSPEVSRYLLRSVTLWGATPDPAGGVVRDRGVPVMRAEPVITEQEWKKLQGRLDAVKHPRTTDGSPNLLTGLCFCGVCGSVHHYRSQMAKGKRYYYNGCSKNALHSSNPNRCLVRNVKAHQLELFAERVFLQHCGDIQVMKRVDRPVEDHAAELERQRGVLGWLYGEVASKGVGVLPQLQAQIDTVSADVDRLAALPSRPAGPEWEATGQTYGEAWSTSTVMDRRQLLLDAHMRLYLAPVPVEEPETAREALKGFVGDGEAVRIGWNPQEDWGVGLVVPVEVALQPAG